jgi:two-component system, OmpR family, osmolarity sensor histidine kinase EnvZ
VTFSTAKLLPGSLLWRTFVLVGLLMLLSVAAWFAIYSAYEREPRARQLAQTLASVANLTRVTLVSAREDARMGVLLELSDREGIHIYPADAQDTIAPLPRDAFLALVHEHVREALGPHTRLSLQRNGEHGLFVSFRIQEDDDNEFWVVLPRERIEQRFPLGWVGWALAAVMLSLLGAWLIVFRITRPLRALAIAARKVGAGQTPELLEEDGPDEIATVARAFNQMHSALTRLDQDRALILAGISHDLRTPLTRLRMSVEMSSDTHSCDESMREGMCADIEDMDSTISQFLDFARADGGEALSEVNIATLIGEIVSLYRRRRTPIDVIGTDDTLSNTTIAVSPALTCAARPKSLHRAITNLIDNAHRYAPGDPVVLDCKVSAGQLIIAVCDRGPGIPSDDTERVKLPFTRLDNARSNVTGAGLGLAIVERIAQSHRGKFELLPNPGGGLRAQLTLPLIAPKKS